MLTAKIARICITDVLNPKMKNVSLIYRNFSSQSKENIFRRGARSKLMETVVSEPTPIRIGKAFVAGSSVIGIGSLAYYGLGLSNQAGFIDRASIWPSYVRERISNTYQYFGGSLAITAASALAVARSPAMMNLVTRNSFLAIFASFAAVMGSGMLVRSIPYEQGKFGSKQLAWALHAGLLGALIAPITLLGGPLVMRAAWYTAGVVGGLSTVAATAPSDKFLNMAGPLSVGLGLVFAASVGSMFFPPTTRMGLSLYSLSIYGGLVLFSMFLLYDTQRIVQRSETALHFDPVNESISIYMNTLNIFMRFAMILSGGNRRK